jgi:hypothetical protein
LFCVDDGSSSSNSINTNQHVIVLFLSRDASLLSAVAHLRVVCALPSCSTWLQFEQKPNELCEDNWRNIFATNVDGVFHTVRAAYPLLKQSKHSKVVITSSIAGEDTATLTVSVVHKSLRLRMCWIPFQLFARESSPAAGENANWQVAV